MVKKQQIIFGVIILLGSYITLVNNIANAQDNIGAKNGKPSEELPLRLISKLAVLKGEVGIVPDDIQGWKYWIFDPNNNSCYTYYEEPNGEVTPFEETSCPSSNSNTNKLMSFDFDAYRIESDQAIEIMNKSDCGNEFIAMCLRLTNPLTVVDAKKGKISEWDCASWGWIPSAEPLISDCQPPEN